MDSEIWKDVEGFENYEVSTFGNIRHKINKVNRAPQDNGNGYKYVGVKKDGKNVNIYIHIAVATAFIENDDKLNKTQVGHWDETRDNNRVENLYWTTPKDNCNMLQHLNRLSIGRGFPTLCVETGIVYQSGREAARRLNLPQSSLYRACRDEQKTCGGFHWKYVKTKKENS